jgi:hypothetical protein
MGLLNPLHHEISETLGRQGEHGILVWYDPGGTLEDLAQEATPPGTSFVRFRGSYLALRYEVEEQAPDLTGRWVLYIPESPPPESWLRDLEMLGERRELDLLELVHRRYGLPVTLALRRILRDRPENARLLARAWRATAPDRLDSQEEVIQALFGLAFELSRWDPEEALFRFVAQSGWRERLEPRGLWEEWVRWVADYAGQRDVPEDEAGLRDRLTAAALLCEFIRLAPALASAFDFLPPDGDRRERLAELARNWRDRSVFQDSYERQALEVERRYNLASRVSLSNDLLRAETFAFVDELWRREVRAAVGSGGSGLVEKAGRIREIAQTRETLFWSRRLPELKKAWESIGLAARLVEEARHAVEQSEHLRSVVEFIERYTSQDGWWRLDLWALELAAGEEVLEPEERRCFVLPAWRAYATFLNTVNCRFVEAVSREGWCPEQPTFWQSVRSYRQRTAVFFVDAFRYDLARRIAESLGDRLSFDIKAVRGVLPSITELGMAALLPDADRGLEVALEPDRIRVRVGGREVGSRPERRAWLERHLGRKGRTLDFDEMAGADLADVERLVVFSQELDEYGTFAVHLHPRGLLELVEGIARAIRLLLDRGFQRFLLVADHGFLYVPPDIEPDRLSAGTARVVKHRFAVGARLEGCWTVAAQELGLQNSDVLAFPAGLAVFSLSGAPSCFLHGGLSLQESLVPLFTAQPIGRGQRMDVSMEVPDPITSRIAVIKVRAQGTDLLAAPRVVRVRVGERESNPVELGHQRMEVDLTIPWLDVLAGPPGAVKVELVDVETGEVLDRREVRVELVV